MAKRHTRAPVPSGHAVKRELWIKTPTNRHLS